MFYLTFPHDHSQNFDKIATIIKKIFALLLIHFLDDFN